MLVLQVAVDIGKSLNNQLCQALKFEEQDSTREKVGFVPAAEYTSKVCQ